MATPSTALRTAVTAAVAPMSPRSMHPQMSASICSFSCSGVMSYFLLFMAAILTNCRRFVNRLLPNFNHLKHDTLAHLRLRKRGRLRELCVQDGATMISNAMTLENHDV